MIQIETPPLNCNQKWRMRNIVNEDGEIIAKATDDHTLSRRPPPPRSGGQPRSKTVLERHP